MSDFILPSIDTMSSLCCVDRKIRIFLGFSFTIYDWRITGGRLEFGPVKVNVLEYKGRPSVSHS